MSDIVRRMMLEGTVEATVHQNARLAGYRMIKAMYDYLFYDRLPTITKTFVDSRILIREHFMALQQSSLKT